jgi:hypothetical protein
MGTGSFPGLKSGRGVTLTPHPLLVPWSRKGRAIPLLPLLTVRPVQSLSACTRVTFTFTYGMGTVHLYVVTLLWCQIPFKFYYFVSRDGLYLVQCSVRSEITAYIQ